MKSHPRRSSAKRPLAKNSVVPTQLDAAKSGNSTPPPTPAKSTPQRQDLTSRATSKLPRPLPAATSTTSAKQNPAKQSRTKSPIAQPKPTTPKSSAPKKRRLPKFNGKIDPKLILKHMPWATLGLLAGMTTLGGSLWLGTQLMFNPHSLLWINQVVPDWIPAPITGLLPPQTLSEIQADLQRDDRRPGKFLEIGKGISPIDGRQVTDLLMPIYEPQPSEPDKQRLVELRLYQPTKVRKANAKREPYYQMVAQLAIAGPDESFVVAPFMEAKSINQGSTRALPLTDVQRFEGKLPQTGVWMNLKGELTRGDSTIAYGRIVHYNPKTYHLSLMQDWTSSVTEGPVWQQITGDPTPELVVNQTVGLEPHFKIYQIRSTNFQPNPIKLESIHLGKPAISATLYENALTLARNGLWTPAVAWMESYKKQEIATWTATAQAQLDVVRLHAQATQAQANQSWSSPGQQVNAYLIDGRWAEGLKIFEASSANSDDTMSMLQSDPGELQTRVNAALKVNPAHLEPKLWAALLRVAHLDLQANVVTIDRATNPTQKDRYKPAIEWFQKQPKTTQADVKRLKTLLSRLTNPTATGLNEAKSADALTVSNSLKVMGTAEAIASVSSDWLKLKETPPLKLEDGQTWYRIQSDQFFDGKQWSPVATKLSPKVEQLWGRFGLSGDPYVQLMAWTEDGQQQTISVEVKAIRPTGDRVEFLAIGAKFPAESKPPTRWLAATGYAMQWVTPETLTLGDWVLRQPTWAKQAMPILADELKQTGLIPPNTPSTWKGLEQLGIGSWMVQVAPLTHAKQLDLILTITPDMKILAPGTEVKAETERSPEKPSRPKTLVIDRNGDMIYSELSAETRHTYRGVADMGDTGPWAFVTEMRGDYQVKRW